MVRDIIINFANDYKAELIMLIGFMASLELMQMYARYHKKALKDSARTKELNRARAGHQLLEATMSEDEKAYVARLERRNALRNYARGR